MKILVVNAGSSSLKAQLIDMDGEKLMCKVSCERIGSQDSFLTYKRGDEAHKVEEYYKDHSDVMKRLLALITGKDLGVIKDLSEIGAFGHRVLHGGDKYSEATLVTPDVLKGLKELIPLGPLHMPANISGIEACMKVLPKVKNVAVFDTAFHSTMPAEAYMYGTPYEWYTKYKVRKYGFHGTSHEYIMNEISRELGRDPKELKIISCHLGNGASICAIDHGKVIDTSMGFTPLEGLLMGTRCGDIDPAVIEYVMDREGLDIHQMLNILNKKSGLLGMSGGLSNDMRDIVKGANAGDEKCILARSRFVHEVKKYVGAYAALLNGVDAIAFAAGTGENRDDIRELIMNDMEYLGVDFDYEANRNFVRGVNYKISKDSSKVAVYIIPTDEEMSIAKQTKNIVSNKK